MALKKGPKGENLPAIDEDEFIRLWKAAGGSATVIAKKTGVAVRNVMRRRRTIENKRGIKLVSGDIRSRHYDPGLETNELRAKIGDLEAALAAVKTDNIDAAYVRSKIVKLSKAMDDAKPPRWLLKPAPAHGSIGVPSVLWSDLHWGEVVDETQVNGINKYNLEIARRRMRRMCQLIIDLLMKWMVKPQYPGIVVNLGGDMIAGDIHEELTATNEADVMVVVLDLFGVLVESLNTMADQFGRVFVVCVSGNHGRNTKKIRAKGRNFTSFDWLLYCFLAKHFEADKRFQFHIPNGPDALYEVFGHKYLLTHGDQFRGGDGMIGHIGPVTRGQRKKQARNAEIEQEFDTMLHGHFHTYSPGRRIIGNGSLVGYGEYSNQANFDVEPPIQAMWITHPEHGITYHIPLYVDEPTERKPGEWVSVFK